MLLELLNDLNEGEVLKLERGNIPEDFVEEARTTVELSHFGNENGLKGMCLAIKMGAQYIGIILIGEAILEAYEASIFRGEQPFRLIGFLIDEKYRGKGIGGQAFRLILDRFYREYGDNPLLLECHRENLIAMGFYEKFGFKNTKIEVNDDILMVKMGKDRLPYNIIVNGK